MKITELIGELALFWKEEGDIEVTYQEEAHQWPREIATVTVEKPGDEINNPDKKVVVLADLGVVKDYKEEL